MLPLTVSGCSVENEWRYTSTLVYDLVPCMRTASIFGLCSIVLVCHLAFSFIMEATCVGMRSVGAVLEYNEDDSFHRCKKVHVSNILQL